MTQRPIRAADLFCGSGGLSTALVLAVEALFPGRELDLVAVNHWQVAIDTHQANHPSVRHFCADLEHLKPRDAVPGGVLDILLAAPSCTYHSRARGDDQPLPTITGSNRGDLAIARPFVSLCTHGNEANATRAVEEPIPTVTTAKGGELTLATPAIAEGYYIDILYRMLHWSELARATSFEDEGRSYHFTGTSTEITKQIGNAVPIRTGAALCREALAA